MRSITVALASLVLCAVSPANAQPDQQPRSAVPSKGLLMGSKMTVENEPCCAGRPAGKPGDRKDATVIAGLGDRAHRDGAILRLKLQGNRTLKITDCADENACEADRFRKHWLAAWWPDLGYYVVNVGLYEAGMAFLISEKDGRATRLVAVPVRSPSGKRAVALVSDLMNGVDLELIDLSVQPPKVTAATEFPACAGAGPNSFLRPKPVWVDDTQVRFEGKSPQPGDNPNTKQLLKIIDGKPQWQC